MQAQHADTKKQITDVKEECRNQREQLTVVTSKVDTMEARIAKLERGGTNAEPERMAPGH